MEVDGDEMAAAEGMVRMSKGMCDDLASDPEIEKVLAAEISDMFRRGGGRRKRMHGGMDIKATVSALLAAICATGRTVFTEITDYPLTRIAGLTEQLNRVNTDPAAKAALMARVKSLAMAAGGSAAIADLSTPGSKLVKLAVIILRALNELIPSGIYGLDRLHALGGNLATIGMESMPVVSTGIVAAASAWGLRIIYRRLIAKFTQRVVDNAVRARDFFMSDEKADEIVDAVIEQIPRLAEMALQAGSGAVNATIRGAAGMYAGRLRPKKESVAVAGAIAALSAPEAAVAVLEAAGESHADAVAEVGDIAPPSGSGRRRRKTRKLIHKSKKRTLRRKY